MALLWRTWTYDDEFSFFSLNLSWIKSLRIQLQERSRAFERVQIDAIKFERTQIHFFSDVFTDVVVVFAWGP